MLTKSAFGFGRAASHVDYLHQSTMIYCSIHTNLGKASLASSHHDFWFSRMACTRSKGLENTVLHDSQKFLFRGTKP